VSSAATTDSAPVFASILSAEAVSASAAPWALPSFDALLRPPPPPPTAAHLQDIEAEAFAEGHARGYAEGFAEGAAAVQEQAQRLRALVQHMANPVAELDVRTEQTLVALMLELARRLVQQELAADPTKLAGIVRDAVSHLAQPVRGVRVRLNPDDAKVVAEHLEPQEPGEEWRVVPDKSLMPGDCVVETESARVDARLDTRQAQLAQRLLGDSA
jgi:flagellar assembly protein FliH